MPKDDLTAAQRFWEISDLRLRLFDEANLSTLNNLIQTERAIHAQAVPVLWREIESRHVSQVLNCPDEARQAAYRDAVRVVCFEKPGWLTQELARAFLQDHSSHAVEWDFVIDGGWHEQPDVLPHDPNRFKPARKYMEAYPFNSKRLAHYLRVIFPRLTHLDLSELDIDGATNDIEDCRIKLTAPYDHDAQEQPEVLTGHAEVLANIKTSQPPVGEMWYTQAIYLNGKRPRNQQVALTIPVGIGLVHVPRVELNLTISPQDLDGAVEDGFEARYGRMARIIADTYSDTPTLLHYVYRLHIDADGMALTIKEVELLIAHYTGRLSSQATDAHTTYSGPLHNYPVRSHPFLEQLTLNFTVAPGPSLNYLLHNPSLKYLDTLELCSNITSDIGPYGAVTLSTWMTTIADHLPLLSSLCLGSVTAPDDLCTPLGTDLYPAQPTLVYVAISVQGEVTRAGDINRAYYVSRWMRESREVAIGLNAEGGRTTGYSETLAQLDRYVDVIST